MADSGEQCKNGAWQYDMRLYACNRRVGSAAEAAQAHNTRTRLMTPLRCEVAGWQGHGCSLQQLRAPATECGAQGPISSQRRPAACTGPSFKRRRRWPWRCCQRSPAPSCSPAGTSKNKRNQLLSACGVGRRCAACPAGRGMHPPAPRRARGKGRGHGSWRQRADQGAAWIRGCLLQDAVPRVQHEGKCTAVGASEAAVESRGGAPQTASGTAPPTAARWHSRPGRRTAASRRPTPEAQWREAGGGGANVGCGTAAGPPGSGPGAPGGIPAMLLFNAGQECCHRHGVVV